MLHATPPLISVLMPVWNGERYVSSAIESVLSQTHNDLELLIVDDGSEDRTREIIDGYAARDERVRPLYRSHCGLVPTLNSGCEAARGRYIARLDHDDIALPERLEQQGRLLDGSPDVALVASSFQCINAAGELGTVVVNPPSEHSELRESLMRTNPFCHSTIMMRADVLAQLGGYRTAYAEAEDYELWTRFADRHQLASIPTVLVLYRIHGRQVSLTRLEQQALVALAIRVATERRWRTGVDALADCGVIDRSTLRALDVSDAEIDAHLVNTYLRCLATLPGLGLGAAALRALREVAADGALLAELEALGHASPAI